ncbi:MAG: prepilin-type N-terminal cleavage/methylation domain-containing protein [Nitrospiraceae bacterium]|nr:prepilin-type N-terminal cleavage/methylation domain-containing protein [Nitrospiraceae bacterium]
MTRTSTTGTCSRGLTLLELVVVLFIISLFFTLAVPVFRRHHARPDALKMASLLRELNDSSIAMKKNFDITFNLDTGFVSWTGPEGRESATFKDLTMVQTPSKGAVKDGTLTVIFGSEGAPEDIDVYLEDPAKTYEVRLNALSGRVRIKGLEKK